jgi:hypothetical protein
MPSRLRLARSNIGGLARAKYLQPRIIFILITSFYLKHTKHFPFTPKEKYSKYKTNDFHKEIHM